LTMTDPCSKEVPVIEVEVSIGGERVCQILDPGTAMDVWAAQHRPHMHFIQPGNRCRWR
jgi:putative transposase